MPDLSSDRLKVRLVQHDPTWTQQAASECVRLAAAIGGTLVTIDHIGSTAIPGIVAKPIIDLQPQVCSLAELDTRQEAVEALGYQWKGEFGLPGRRYCTKDIGGDRRFQVHCFEQGASPVLRHLMFRDYLRAHSHEARSYEAVKREAAATHPADTLAYNDHKSPWIKACEARAAVWNSARR
jgi:GrpB-like predicted nucleotidyltransferase (UPF0157 family)